MSLTCPAAALQQPRVPTLLSAFLTLLNDRLSESIVFPLLPFLLASFNADGRTLGLLAGSYALAQFAATPLIGALSDRFGRRPVIATCVAGSVLGLGLFALTVSMDWPKGATLPLMLLFGARLIDGVSGGTAATAGAVLADITPEEQRARAFGLIGVAFGLGFIIGPFVGGQLARINVTVPIWVATGFALFNLLVVLGLLPETHPRSARQAMPRKRDLNPFAQIAKVIGNPAVGRLCLSFFLFFLAFNGFTAILVLYFKQRFNWGPELATTAFLIVGIVATVVQGGLIGPLVKRLGEWKLTLIGLGNITATSTARRVQFRGHPRHRNRPGHPKPAQSRVAPPRLGGPGHGIGQPSGTAEPGEFPGTTPGRTQLRPIGTDQSLRWQCLSADHGDAAGGRQPASLQVAIAQPAAEHQKTCSPASGRLLRFASRFMQIWSPDE